MISLLTRYRTTLILLLLLIGHPKALAGEETKLKSPVIEILKKIAYQPEARGEKYYRHYCMICHGEKGHGDGFNAFNLKPRPKDFAKTIPRMSDTYLYRVIAKGTAAVGRSPLSPPYERTLGRGKIEDLIAYLRTLY